jgi:uncharacterized membrane protein
MEKTTFSQRMTDSVTAFCGSWTCVFLFSAMIVAGVILNSAMLWFGVFDPYPYIFLNLVLTVVSTLQGPLIMLSQNRMADRDRDAVASLHEKLDWLLSGGD